MHLSRLHTDFYFCPQTFFFFVLYMGSHVTDCLLYLFVILLSFCILFYYSLIFTLCCLCPGLLLGCSLSILCVCCSAAWLSLDIKPNWVPSYDTSHVYPITMEVLHQVFSPHGFVEQIATFQKSSGQHWKFLFSSFFILFKVMKNVKI